MISSCQVKKENLRTFISGLEGRSRKGRRGYELSQSLSQGESLLTWFLRFHPFYRLSDSISSVLRSWVIWLGPKGLNCPLAREKTQESKLIVEELWQWFINKEKNTNSSIHFGCFWFLSQIQPTMGENGFTVQKLLVHCNAQWHVKSTALESCIYYVTITQGRSI